MGLINKKAAIIKLKEGTPVAVPTETVYGLAAPISNTKALERIFSIKKRPFSNPLIVHVNSLDMTLNLVKDPHKDSRDSRDLKDSRDSRDLKDSRDSRDSRDLENLKDLKVLANKFWPGPLTLVLEKILLKFQIL